MSLEILISKYIDGDLTPKEDVKLRDSIRDNKYAKAKFDSSVDLHHQLKHDASNIEVPEKLLRKTEEMIQLKMLSTVLKQDAASIQVPEKLLRDTEDKILMRILANNAKVIKVSKPAIDWYKYSAAAILLIGLMFSVLFNVTEQKYPRDIAFTNENITIPIQQNVETSSNRSNFPTAPFFNEELTIALDNDAIINEENINSDTPITIDQSVAYSEIVVDEQIFAVLADENTSKLKEYEPNLNMQSQLPFTPNYQGTTSNFMIASNLPMNYFVEPFSGLTEVQLHTFISYDFARNGFNTSNNTPVLNISQSISYTATDRISVGIEFGITELNYDRRQNIILHNNTDQSNGPSVQLPTGSDEDYLILPVYIETQRQFYWGTAVIDYALIKSNDFMLNARLGLGGSNEGPLGFSRVYAQYDLFKYLSINLGAEGRLFVNELPNSQYSRALRSNTAIVYGIRLKF